MTTLVLNLMIPLFFYSHFNVPSPQYVVSISHMTILFSHLVDPLYFTHIWQFHEHIGSMDLTLSWAKSDQTHGRYLLLADYLWVGVCFHFWVYLWVGDGWNGSYGGFCFRFFLKIVCGLRIVGMVPALIFVSYLMTDFWLRCLMSLLTFG